jgi:hypothetical protein
MVIFNLFALGILVNNKIRLANAGLNARVKFIPVISGGLPEREANHSPQSSAEV